MTPCCCCSVNQKSHRRPRDRRGRGGGFSLVELLVVIGIIAVLIGILIPVVGRMRREAYRVDTAALINTIRSACESYQSNFKSYPGPFADADVYNKVKWNKSERYGIPTGINQANFVTGTEQLVLSLCGGLKLRNPSDMNSDVDYVLAGTLSSGPANLNPRSPKTYDAFITDAGKHLAPGWDGASNFQDAAGNVAKDTNVPEFVDKYPSDELPILYLRARRNAPGVITDGSTPNAYQYDLRQITGYTWIMNASAKPEDTPHGLQDINDDDASSSVKESMERRKSKSSIDAPVFGASAIPYFRAAAGAKIMKGAQDSFSPRSRDSFILISAGPDRIYGTYDDITSFGSVE